MSDYKDQIWAYIHDELAANEKVLFEQALENDPALRQKVEERQATDSTLKDLFRK